MLEQRKTTKKQSQNSWSCFDSDVVSLPRYSVLASVGCRHKTLTCRPVGASIGCRHKTLTCRPVGASIGRWHKTLTRPSRWRVHRTLARTGSGSCAASLHSRSPICGQQSFPCRGGQTTFFEGTYPNGKFFREYGNKKGFPSESSKEQRHARFEHDVPSKAPNSAKILSQNLVLSFVFNQLPSHRS